MQLIIVESPTKSKTISKFLGKDYVVKSSFGHVRDLPKSDMGVDVERDFTPKYIIPPKARAVIKELKAIAEKADEVIYATDEDREGESIAWHLVEALKQDKGAAKRIVFHEITKSAIEHALKNPRSIDVKLVDAQQARRILDRLVGYELSPFLWKKVRYGLSAGRVQSVAVRLVVERQREIDAFKPQEYWTIEADLTKSGQDKPFRAVLTKIRDTKLEKFDIATQAKAQQIVQELEGASYTVEDVQTKEVRRTPAAPFTTSTLQQEASRKLGLSAKQTMMVAQQLYETGSITYMRTDSVTLSQSALAQARQVITELFGKSYALPNPRYYQNKSKGAQEAHEAIRPTDLSLTPDHLPGADRNQQRLYDLIWKRTLATQMEQAVFDQTSVDIRASRTESPAAAWTFRASGQVLKFDGFMRVYTEGRDTNDDEDKEGMLPELAKNDDLDLKELKPLQHFTEPPPRFTDATLVKALEQHGIGRPSTYAPTLSTIQERGYVEKLDKQYHPTEIGILVNDMLVEHFPEIVDINFTSHVEEELDDIAEGKLRWTSVLKEFYQPFKKNLENKQETVMKAQEVSEVPCEHCGQKMLIKFGRNGKFLACPDPTSKITKPMPEEAETIKALEQKTKDEQCPECGKSMKVRRGKFGYFLGCTEYPRCKGIAKIVNKIGFACPNCGKGELIERHAKRRGSLFYGCSRYPDCTFLVNKQPSNQEELNDMLVAWKEKPKKPVKIRKAT